MNNKADLRHEDHGPQGRRADVKNWVVMGALALNICAVVWKGGELSAKFDTLLTNQAAMQAQLGAMNAVLGSASTEIRVLQERIEANNARLTNHEVRLDRLEGRRP